MRQSHLILSNATVMWLTQALLIIPQLVLVPFLIGTIGESGYGVYALIWSLLVSIDRLEMSLQKGVVKYSAGFLAQRRIAEVNRVVSSSFVYSLFIAVITSAGILTAAALYRDPEVQIASALVVVGVMVLLIIPLTPYVAVIQSRQRYYIGAVADTVARYIGLLAVVAWFHAVNPSVEALIVIMAAMLLFSRLVQVPVAYRLVPGLRNRPRFLNRRSFLLIASFGAANVLATLCLAANSTGVRWLMNSLASTDFVARLAIILMPGMFLSQVILAVTVTIMPATSAYQATGNRRMLQELLIRGMRYTTILSLAAVLAAGLLIRNLFNLWVGPDYLFLAPYSLILFGSWAFMLTSSCAHQMLKGLGKLRAVVLIYFTGLVAVPLVLILGIYRLRGDPYLAATAGLAAGHLVCGVLNFVVCSRAVAAALPDLLRRVYLQPAAAAAGAALAAGGILTVSGWEGLAGRAVLAGLAVLLYFAGLYAFVSTAEERREAGDLWSLAVRKVFPPRSSVRGKLK